MEVLSLGWQTDLALLALGGSTVEHHPTYVVVGTPENPAYYWGNFLLLRRAPLRRDVPRVVELFEQAFPGASHRSLGVDDPAGTAEDLQPLADAGFTIDCSTVLTASGLEPPRHLNTAVEVRRLETDEDWRARVDLHLAIYGDGATPAYREFAQRRSAAERRLVDGGHGAWFGAFEDGRMLSGTGIVRAGPGPARYQDVETVSSARGRGLAGTLVYAAGRHALERMGAATLVIVADPDYRAARLYRALGFRDTETQLQALRSPAIRS